MGYRTKGGRCGGRIIRDVDPPVDVGSGLVDALYSGPLATRIKNALPSMNKDARPGFAGEKHALLKNPNGTFSFGNWMGPGSKITKRLKRGDKGINESDTISKAHDLRYALAKGDNRKVRMADNRMLSSLKKAEAAGTDSKFNTRLGRAVIGAKVLSENLGIKNDFGKAEPLTEEEKKMYEEELSKLETQGYGLKKLKKNVLKLAKKQNKGSGALDIVSIVKNGIAKALPMAEKESGLKVPKAIKDQIMKYAVDTVTATNVKMVMAKILEMIKNSLPQNKGSGFFSDFWDGFTYSFNSVISAVPEDASVEGVPVGKIASKIRIPGAPTSLDDIKARKKDRDNRDQADKDSASRIERGETWYTPKQFENLKKNIKVLMPMLTDAQRNDLIEKASKQVSETGYAPGRELPKGVLDSILRPKGSKLIGSGVKLAGKGPTEDIETLKKISADMVEKLKNVKVSPNTLKTKLKKLLPKLGKAALAAVAVFTAGELFKKTDLYDKIDKETNKIGKDLFMNAVQGKYKGSGIKLAGVNKGGEIQNSSELKDIATKIANQMRSLKTEVKPQSFFSKVKKYLPKGLTAAAATTVAAAIGLVLFGNSKLNQAVDSLKSGSGINLPGGSGSKGTEMDTLLINKISKVLGKGAGIKLPGSGFEDAPKKVKKEFKLSDIKSGYEKLRKKYLDMGN